MKDFPAKFKAFIASLLVMISFILPYYPQKMDVSVDAITVDTQTVDVTFENNTNRNVVSVPDEFYVEYKSDEGWVKLENARITDGFEALDSAMTDTLTVSFGVVLAEGDYTMVFTFKTTNGWLTSGRTFTTTYDFTVAE